MFLNLNSPQINAVTVDKHQKSPQNITIFVVVVFNTRNVSIGHGCPR